MSNSPVIAEITPDELYQDIRRGNLPFILDVRNEDEFCQLGDRGRTVTRSAQYPLFCVPG